MVAAPVDDDVCVDVAGAMCISIQPVSPSSTAAHSRQRAGS
jgi:hypothetical protein